MDILDSIKGNEVLMAVVLFLTAMTLYGHYRGLIRMLLSAASIVITLVLADLVLPYTREFLIREGILKGLTEGIGDRLSESLQASERTDYQMFYELIGADKLAETAAGAIGEIVLNIICFLVLFILIRLLIRIFVKVFDLITRLPVISGLNQLGGAAVGFLEGVIYVWIAMAIATLTPTLQLSELILSQTAANEFLAFIYQNNLIVQFILGIFGV